MEIKSILLHDLEAELEKVIAWHERKDDDLIEVLYWIQVYYEYVPEKLQQIVANKTDIPVSIINDMVLNRFEQELRH